MNNPADRQWPHGDEEPRDEITASGQLDPEESKAIFIQEMAASCDCDSMARIIDALKKSPNVLSSARECDGLACMFDVLAGRATSDDERSGKYGNWLHDSEILRMAARILRRSVEQPPKLKD